MFRIIISVFLSFIVSHRSAFIFFSYFSFSFALALSFERASFAFDYDTRAKLNSLHARNLILTHTPIPTPTSTQTLKNINSIGQLAVVVKRRIKKKRKLIHIVQTAMA